MRAYSASAEEALRARNLLKDWTGEGFLTEAQCQLVEPELVCDFRRTNIFLRLVLFFFTLLIVRAAVALFFVVFTPSSSQRSTGIVLLFFAALSYGAAEVAVAQFRLYRYGIEEAFAVCSVGLLCAGVQTAFFRDVAMQSPVPAAGAIASLWIWRRFGLPYAFLASMIFVLWLPAHWTASHAARHVILAAFYTFGLIAVAAVRSRHRLTYLDKEYSIAEALLWLGIYLTINLQLSSLDLLGKWWAGTPAHSEFSGPFYWATWALIWCLPPAVLVRGVLLKDRLVIAVGALVAALTLATNKPYLGWPRHTWDPMILGIVLVGVALLLRRWLASGPDGIRRGFTAQRLSGKDKHWMNAGTVIFGAATPQSLTVRPQTGSPDAQFGGGDSGGGGASSDF